MSDTRTIKELYEILYEEIKDRNFIPGLCNVMNCIFTVEDENKIKSHFVGQKYLHPEFMTEERNWVGGKYWWKGKEDCNPINRKAFIQKIISTL